MSMTEPTSAAAANITAPTEQQFVELLQTNQAMGLIQQIAERAADDTLFADKARTNNLTLRNLADNKTKKAYHWHPEVLDFLTSDLAGKEPLSVAAAKQLAKSVPSLPVGSTIKAVQWSDVTSLTKLNAAEKHLVSKVSTETQFQLHRSLRTLATLWNELKTMKAGTALLTAPPEAIRELATTDEGVAEYFFAMENLHANVVDLNTFVETALAIHRDAMCMTVERYQRDVMRKALLGSTASEKRKQETQFTEGCTAEMTEELAAAYKKRKRMNALHKTTSSSSSSGRYGAYQPFRAGSQRSRSSFGSSRGGRPSFSRGRGNGFQYNRRPLNVVRRNESPSFSSASSFGGANAGSSGNGYAGRGRGR